MKYHAQNMKISCSEHENIMPGTWKYNAQHMKYHAQHMKISCSELEIPCPEDENIMLRTWNIMPRT
jgi:hypothetical protein